MAQAHEIMGSASSALAAIESAERIAVAQQHWLDESTSYEFADESVLLVTESQLNAFDSAADAAMEWHNANPKKHLLDYAKSVDLDLFDANGLLVEDWADQVISRKTQDFRA